MRQKNPFDPLDDLWRWLDQLWPAERWAFWTGVTATVIVLLLWVTR